MDESFQTNNESLMKVSNWATTNESQRLIPVWTPVNTYIYILTTLISGWTVAANATILVCFYHIRRKKITSFGLLTFSMTISDLLVGLIWLVYLAGNRNKGQLVGIVCSSTIYLVVSIQCVSLFHVLGICISRNKTLQNPSAIDLATRQKKRTSNIILLSWIIPLVVLLIPFAAWGEFTVDQIVCRVDVVFGDNLKIASTFVSAFYFTLQCLTDIIYIVSVLRLWFFARNRVVPIEPTVTVNVSTQRISIVNTQTTQLAQHKLSTVKYQRDVMVAVGLLLLSFNLLTLPNTVGLLFTGKLKTVNPIMIYITNSCFILSSGLNPIVYGFCVPPIKKTIIQASQTLLKLIRNRR